MNAMSVEIRRRGPGLNRGHHDQQSCALSTVLLWHRGGRWGIDPSRMGVVGHQLRSPAGAQGRGDGKPPVGKIEHEATAPEFRAQSLARDQCEANSRSFESQMSMTVQD